MAFYLQDSKFLNIFKSEVFEERALAKVLQPIKDAVGLCEEFRLLNN